MGVGIRAAGELLFPHKCPVCGEIVPIEKRREFIISGFSEDTGAYACGECPAEFAYVRKPYCSKCGKQLMFDDNEGLCHDCSEKDRSFIAGRILMSYDELARDVLAGLKYHGRKESASFLGLLAAQRLGTYIRSVGTDVILPVPAHPERIRERGYNQAELLAREIGRLLGIPVAANLVKRVKNTSAQKGLGARERFLNLENAFRLDMKCAEEIIRLNHGRAPTVLIVDDIYTTGATLESVTGALYSGGCCRNYSLCIAAGRDTVKSAAGTVKAQAGMAAKDPAVRSTTHILY